MQKQWIDGGNTVTELPKGGVSKTHGLLRVASCERWTGACVCEQ